VPLRLHAGLNTAKLAFIPFGEPVDTRQLTLIRHLGKPLSRFDSDIKAIFAGLPGA